MITNEVMTPLAEEAAARYQALLDGWIASFHLGVLRHDDAATSRRRLEQDFGTAERWLADEGARIVSDFTSIAREARLRASRDLGVTTAQELSDDALGLLEATCAYAAGEISGQIQRDQRSLRRSLLATEIQLAAARNASAADQLALRQRLAGATPTTGFADRAGRNWKSRLFVRSVWRQSMLSIFNEVTLLTIASHGGEGAQVRHLSEKAGVHGMFVAITPDGDGPVYGEIRDEVFHPNAEAILTVPEDMA